MENKISSVIYGSFLFLSLSQDGVCSHLIDKDFECPSNNKYKIEYDISMEEEQDPLEELFLGRFSLDKNNLYFESLKNETDEYNQSISEASFFLAEQLKETKNIDGAALAYAYAYYYDPCNESIDFPEIIKKEAINLKTTKNKDNFIQSIYPKILALYK